MMKKDRTNEGRSGRRGDGETRRMENGKEEAVR